jgi:hypothetical protein
LKVLSEINLGGFAPPPPTGKSEFPPLAPSLSSSRIGFDRVYPVYYEISFELETLSIYPIKTHSRETWGKSIMKQITFLKRKVPHQSILPDSASQGLF